MAVGAADADRPSARPTFLPESVPAAAFERYLFVRRAPSSLVEWPLFDCDGAGEHCLLRTAGVREPGAGSGPPSALTSPSSRFPSH